MDCTFPATSYLCGACDAARHPYAHFHRRHSFAEGFWKPLPPLTSFAENGERYERGLCFNIEPLACDECPGPQQWSLPMASREPITYILHGRHEFRRGECKCGSCGRMQKASALEFIAIGAWPCTSDVNRTATFVDERVLSHYAALKNAAPSLSTRAFLEGLVKTSLAYGGTGKSINQTTFTDCYLEWRYKEEACQQHMRDIDLALGNDKVDGRTCGGLWAAAGDRKSRSEKMTITGSTFAVCRHQVPQAAVNIYQTGERYSYSHYLLTAHILPERGPTFLSQDIACKHRPWRLNVEGVFENEAHGSSAALRTRCCAEQASQLVDVLPEAHGIVHAFACQVLYGALHKQGAAAESGEDAELLFGHMSSASHTTRNMSEGGRDDSLTHLGLDWGQKKRGKQPKLIKKRMIIICAKLIDAQAAFIGKCREVLSMDIVDAEMLISTMFAQIEELAERQLRQNRSKADNIVEFFCLEQRISDAQQLMPFLGGGVRQHVARAVAAVGGDITAVQDLVALLVAGLPAMITKRDALRSKVLDALYRSGILKHHHKLRVSARTSKEKAKMRGKMRSDVKQVEAAVKMYNEVVPFGSTPRAATLTATDIMCAEPCLPWAAELPAEGEAGAMLRRYGTLKCIQLCDAHHKVQRLQEETALLDRELQQYIDYCSAKIVSIDALLSRVGLLPLHDALDFAGLPKSGRYYCSSGFEVVDGCVSLPSGAVKAGVKALLMRARAEFVSLLLSAQQIASQPNVASSTPFHALVDDLEVISNFSSDASDMAPYEPADELAEMHV
ncbi:g5358 [Coccomyxa elongata]